MNASVYDTLINLRAVFTVIICKVDLSFPTLAFQLLPVRACPTETIERLIQIVKYQPSIDRVFAK